MHSSAHYTAEADFFTLVVSPLWECVLQQKRCLWGPWGGKWKCFFHRQEEWNNDYHHWGLGVWGALCWTPSLTLLAALWIKCGQYSCSSLRVGVLAWITRSSCWIWFKPDRQIPEYAQNPCNGLPTVILNSRTAPSWRSLMGPGTLPLREPTRCLCTWTAVAVCSPSCRCGLPVFPIHRQRIEGVWIELGGWEGDFIL